MKKNSRDDEAVVKLYKETEGSLYKITKKFNNFPMRWGLSFNAFLLLDYLYTHNDHAESAEAADELTIPRQTMTALLDGFEKKGILTRSPHPEDRRRKIIRLTKEGYAKVQCLKRENLATEMATLKQMGEKDIRKLLELVLRYTKCLEQAAEAYDGPVTKF